MGRTNGTAAPESGDDVTYEQLRADPEIAALLEFAPAPRKVKRPDGWTPERQRQFIAWLAHEGSPGLAARRMGKRVSGIEAIYNGPNAESFKAAWDGAFELAMRREEARMQGGVSGGGRAPGIKARGAMRAANDDLPPGPEANQVRNEFGEWEDADSYAERAEEAKHSIAHKLVRIRRLFLQEISGCPGKRAAFEILTDLPIDWDKAAAGKAQADEPYRNGNQRKPDMVLLAESGWSFGEIGYGPDKKAELRAAIDRHREERGQAPIDWSDSAEV